jgi:TonB family protein
MRYLLIILCILLSSKSYAQTTATICDAPEEKAYFQYGQDSLDHFIKRNTHFRTIPGNEAAGKAVVVFIVETNGSIGNAEIISTSGDTDFDKEAVRVIKTMAGWKPAKNKGKTVRSTSMLSVAYQVR